MIDILAIGELLIDFTPLKTERGTAFKVNPGGAPCNMLAMAQAMGAKTSFIGKVGHDQFGLTLKKTLDSAGIGTKGLILSKDLPTPLAFVHLSDEGDRSFSFYRKGCADVMLRKEEIDFSLIDKAKVLHFGSLSFTDEPSKSTVLDVLAYAKSKNKLISYDPNYRPALWTSETDAIEAMKLGLTYADFLKVADDEAALLTGQSHPEKAAKLLFDQGVSLVTITLGQEGVYYKHACGQGYVSGFKSKVLDTTGAGDSFFGALMAQYIQSSNENLTKEVLETYLKTANAAASIVVEGFGGIPSIPSKEAVFERVVMSDCEGSRR